MHNGNSRKSVIVLLALTTLLVFPLDRANAYWAIAWAQGQAGAWAAGREFNHASAAEASSRALESCRSSARSRGINPDGCQIISSGNNGCSALAISRNDNGYGLAGQQRALPEADRAAIAACTARNAQGCDVPDGANFCDTTAEAAAAPPAAARVANDEQDCAEREGSDAIAACTRIINARRLQGRALATIHALRGTAYRKIENLDLALADFTRTIELLRQSAGRDVTASAYLARAAIHALKQDEQKALGDYRSALNLDPRNGTAIEEIRRIELARAPPPPPQPQPQPQPVAAEVSDPPLPRNVTVSAEVLLFIEGHPLFASAPPIAADAVITANSSLSQGVVNGAATTSTSKSETTSRRIRQHVMHGESKMQASTRHTACPPGSCTTNSSTATLEAANGLISLGSRSTTSALGNRYISSTRLVRVENVNGTLYPVQVGNRYSYDLTYKTESTGYNDEYVTKSSCVVTTKYDAQSFHPDLRGAAYLTVCDDRFIYKKYPASNNRMQTKSLYLDYLAVWTSADRVTPNERIMQAGYQNTMGMEHTGSDILVSFSITQ